MTGGSIIIYFFITYFKLFYANKCAFLNACLIIVWSIQVFDLLFSIYRMDFNSNKYFQFEYQKYLDRYSKLNKLIVLRNT